MSKRVCLGQRRGLEEVSENPSAEASNDRRSLCWDLSGRGGVNFWVGANPSCVQWHRSCCNFFQEWVALPLTGWLVGLRRRLIGRMSEAAGPGCSCCGSRKPSGSQVSSTNLEEGTHTPPLPVAEDARAHAWTLGCVGSWLSSPHWHRAAARELPKSKMKKCLWGFWTLANLLNT